MSELLTQTATANPAAELFEPTAPPQLPAVIPPAASPQQPAAAPAPAPPQPFASVGSNPDLADRAADVATQYAEPLGETTEKALEWMPAGVETPIDNVPVMAKTAGAVMDVVNNGTDADPKKVGGAMTDGATKAASLLADAIQPGTGTMLEIALKGLKSLVDVFMPNKGGVDEAVGQTALGTAKDISKLDTKTVTLGTSLLGAPNGPTSAEKEPTPIEEKMTTAWPPPEWTPPAATGPQATAPAPPAMSAAGLGLAPSAPGEMWAD
jgi:hypothetical protein